MAIDQNQGLRPIRVVAAAAVATAVVVVVACLEGKWPSSVKALGCASLSTDDGTCLIDLPVIWPMEAALVDISVSVSVTDRIF